MNSMRLIGDFLSTLIGKQLNLLLEILVDLGYEKYLNVLTNYGFKMFSCFFTLNFSSLKFYECLYYELQPL
jgi:hypothetical protein